MVISRGDHSPDPSLRTTDQRYNTWYFFIDNDNNNSDKRIVIVVRDIEFTGETTRTVNSLRVTVIIVSP